MRHANEWPDPEWAEELEDSRYDGDQPKTFREMVHSGIRYRAYPNQDEAGARARRGQVVVRGDNGKWYAMSGANARLYYLQCDIAARRDA